MSNYLAIYQNCLASAQRDPPSYQDLISSGNALFGEMKSRAEAARVAMDEDGGFAVFASIGFRKTRKGKWKGRGYSPGWLPYSGPSIREIVLE